MGMPVVSQGAPSERLQSYWWVEPRSSMPCTHANICCQTASSSKCLKRADPSHNASIVDRSGRRGRHM